MPDDDYPDPLTSHNYDGIQEYDNPTPGWWVWLFVLSVLFAPLYLLVSEAVPSLFGYAESYEQAKTNALMKQFAELGELKQDKATLNRFVNDPEESKWLAAGQSIFQANCTACHATGGVGLPGSGPNLTDDHYLNLTNAEGIYRVLNKGANNGAMPAWENKLQSNEVVLVSAYVASLRGKNTPGGMPPEGEIIPPFFEKE
jgi:cytochrome c oxidase cbb3-type subunit 3